MFSALILALAAGTAATTITKARVFATLRYAAARKSHWLGYLISCPYCVAHWLVFGLQCTYRVYLVHSGCAPLDLFVSAFPIIGAAAVVGWVLRKTHSFGRPPR